MTDCAPALRSSSCAALRKRRSTHRFGLMNRDQPGARLPVSRVSTSLRLFACCAKPSGSSRAMRRSASWQCAGHRAAGRTRAPPPTPYTGWAVSWWILSFLVPEDETSHVELAARLPGQPCSTDDAPTEPLRLDRGGPPCGDGSSASWPASCLAAACGCTRVGRPWPRAGRAFN